MRKPLLVMATALMGTVPFWGRRLPRSPGLRSQRVGWVSRQKLSSEHPL